MKCFAIIIILFYSIFSYGQEKSDIEKKYNFVEIIGLNNSSYHDFLTEITSYPEGICEQSLNKMGYIDGNKLPIPYSDKIIITTRKIPEYKNPKKKYQNIDLDKWNKFKSEYNSLGVYERQQVAALLPFITNKKQFDLRFRELQSDLLNYGINLDSNKISKSFQVYNKYSNVFTKEDILAGFNYYKKNDTIAHLANFLAPNYLKNEQDILDFLPFLLNKKASSQSLLTFFIENYNGKIDWNKNMELLNTVVNDPNPYKSLLALRIADKTGFTYTNFKTLMSRKPETIKEILESKYIPLKDKSYLISFMNKYSDRPIETEANQLIYNYY
ncbi:hypothetical protein [Empedobacter brevis]|uniref:hypothetical protein n=1 Tax=Empedobacter brevis TaxID=247 RepID=UPI0039AF91B2